ncbi:undecaprenyl-diphosphate phosphatase [Patescibacteria group bacterium]
MTILQSLILGIVQGVTELLPISSSAHLVLIPEIFNWELQPTSFDITIHAATLLALVIYFRKDLLLFITNYKLLTTKKQILNLLFVSIPAGLIGLFFNDFIEQNFKSVRIIVIMMVTIGLVMLFIDKFSINNSKKIKELSTKNSAIIGAYQAIALIRGTSRSGITMIGGMFNGLERKQAAKFAFLAGIPIMIAVSVKQFVDFGIDGFGELEPINLIVGFLSAFISSILTIRFLMKFLEKYGLTAFGIYRIIIGIIIIAIELNSLIVVVE